MAARFGNFRLAISDARYFFGRGELISEVVRSPFEVRVLLGGRRLGKTSVLNAIRWSLLMVGEQEPNRVLPVLVNLQQEQPRSLDNFRYLLINRLRETIQNPTQEAGLGFDLRQTYSRFLRQISGGGVSLLGIKLNVTNPDQEQQLIHDDFSQDLRNIIKELHQQNCQGVCFIFDGAEYLVKQEWANDAWSYLRSLKDTTNTSIQPFLGLFLSGYRDLKDYHQEIGSPLFNIAEAKWLTTLTFEETKQLIARRCQDAKLNLDEKEINQVIEWAGCHPYLTNQMLNTVFNNRHRKKPLSDENLRHDLIRQHRQNFSAWWDEEERSYGFGEQEQVVYLALIQERQGTAESLAEKVDLSVDKIEDALEVLAGTGVIRKLDYETYVIGARLFEKWVTQEKEVQPKTRHKPHQAQVLTSPMFDYIKTEPTIGIITALPKEYAAVKKILENTKEISFSGQGAGRRYLLGEVSRNDEGKHTVVLCLASMGNNIAAIRASLLLNHFPDLKSIIMVGIAGGIPHPEKTDDHVRLGDIVISNEKGVIQYDFDKETITENIYRHPPRPPSASLIEGVRLLEADELMGKKPWLDFIDQALLPEGEQRPSIETDILVSSTDSKQIVEHPQDSKRKKDEPRVFIAPIASANKLLKNPIKRDQLRDKFGVKAVEMEASGIADATWSYEIGYLVVRGICDYCDSNKGDNWQAYAAAVAAAYTRALLESIPTPKF